MSPVSLSQIVADAWEHRLRISEDPLKSRIFNEMFRLPRVTYREHLDRIRINVYGEKIPRIAIVRDNIQRLGRPKVAPRLPA